MKLSEDHVNVICQSKNHDLTNQILLKSQLYYYQWILFRHFKFSICHGEKQNNEENF